MTSNKLTEGHTMIGYIVVEPDLHVERVPDFLLGQDEILWPVSENLLHEQVPGQGVHFINPTHFYKRHRMKDTGIEVYVREPRDPNALPGHINAEIHQRAARPTGTA